MGRIEEIKRLEKIADRHDKASSDHRWQAAELIWEEVTEGTSRRELAESIGKSHTHVRYMFNAWDMVGRKIDGDLPDFNQVYNSNEIRGTSEPGELEGGTGGGDRSREPGPDYTAHGHVVSAANAIDALARNRAFWPLLTDDDIAIIRELPDIIDGLLRDIGR